jgi:hypothetical protein
MSETELNDSFDTTIEPITENREETEMPADITPNQPDLATVMETLLTLSQQMSTLLAGNQDPEEPVVAEIPGNTPDDIEGIIERKLAERSSHEGLIKKAHASFLSDPTVADIHHAAENVLKLVGMGMDPDEAVQFIRDTMKTAPVSPAKLRAISTPTDATPTEDYGKVWERMIR